MQGKILSRRLNKVSSKQQRSISKSVRNYIIYNIKIIKGKNVIINNFIVFKFENKMSLIITEGSNNNKI